MLHSFAGGPADGADPASGLWRDKKSGSLLGTSFGGGLRGYGTVFKVDLTGKESVLYSFTGGADGGCPQDYGTLVTDGAGSFYGTTYCGGSGSCTPYYPGCGVVFKLDKTGETVLHSFTGPPSDGGLPNAALVRDAAGNLYGTASGGSGSCPARDGCGVIFKLDAAGNETVLYNFTGGADGSFPVPNLILDPAGNLYGTTYEGGDLSLCSGGGCGVVFELTP